MQPMLSTIKTDRNLKARLRAIAREALGPNASEAEVEAWAHEAYDGPTPRFPPQESPETSQDRIRRSEEAAIELERWKRFVRRRACR